MISHRLLTYDTIFELIPHINAEQNLLFYSYLTQRKEKAQYICQFINSQLTAVLAYLSDYSFPAFSFFRVEELDIYFPELIAFTRETIKLDEDAVCGTILCQRDLELFQSFGLIKGLPQRFLTMKHQNESKLLESQIAKKISENEYSKVIDFLHSGEMRFFTRSELENCPFLGIKEGEEFIAVGGYHFYDSQLVELGNIITRLDYRGRGLAKLLTSELTRLGKKRSPDVYLGVLANNLPAVRVYEGLGYETTMELSIVNFTLSSRQIT
ncbi:GNAT family N-acetyltransferase [Bacillus sp. FJAT-26390]|uniref:GNAT family N-acetyltransferase n=1 Tax=Bacillus sp. FJAT-26390 TaxID=1743142 RepID=UPI000807B9F2|nr:GNAT family N-acetyltransferase [Bacillus sp. FJAT-26390]OBZ17198.1 GCN5 family acetyltransferase [Bacillus sp. FJAT-26390]